MSHAQRRIALQGSQPRVGGNMHLDPELVGMRPLPRQLILHFAPTEQPQTGLPPGPEIAVKAVALAAGLMFVDES